MNSTVATTTTTAAAYYASNDDFFTQLILLIIGRILVVAVCIGLVGNTTLFLSVRHLVRNASMARSGGLLLMIESFFDGTMCFLCIIYVLFLNPNSPLPQPSPGGNVLGIEIAAYLLCYAWYSELAYWIFETLSVCNLVMLTIDRYIAVTQPMKHREFVTNLPRTLAIFYTIDVLYSLVTALDCDIYIYNYVASAGGASANSSEYYSANSSVSTTVYVCGATNAAHQAVYRWYLALWGLFYYLIPVAIMVFCYSSMIVTLSRSSEHLGAIEDAESAKKNVKSRAAKQLVKTVIVLGIMFILCLAQDDITTALCGLGLYDYVVNTPIQQMGVLFIALNYTVAPYTVFFFMPPTRQPLKELLHRLTRR